MIEEPASSPEVSVPGMILFSTVEDSLKNEVEIPKEIASISNSA